MAQVMTAVVNTSTVETEATIRIPLTFIMEEGLDFLQNYSEKTFSYQFIIFYKSFY